MKNLFFILLFPTLILSQTQIGQRINGEAEEDQAGHDVSISSNGNIIAVGARYNDGNGMRSGHVRVFENIAGNWTKIGQDIDGAAAEDRSGSTLSLSSDGSIVAIGASSNDGNGSQSGHVRVFENIDGTWTKIGQDITGKMPGDGLGWSLDLSSDGNIVVVNAGGSLNGPGLVRVYENISNVWTQIGSDIEGEAADDQFGVSVSISSEGTIIAVGGQNNDGNGSNSGHVRVFENVAGTWIQLGQDIDGESIDDQSGSSISLSANGNIVAIGAVANDGNGSNSGHVRIFEYIAGTWIQIGQDIDGEASGDHFGSNVSLSSDGSIVAIGGIFNDGAESDTGHIQVYKNMAGSWMQIGQDIEGDAYLDLLSNVELSSDGTYLVAGARNSSNNGIRSGHADVYDLSLVLSNNDFVTTEFTIHPNSSSSKINIQINEIYHLKTVNLYNNIGQIVEVNLIKIIDVSKLAKGLYFVEVITNKGSFIKKVVVN